MSHFMLGVGGGGEKGEGKGKGGRGKEGHMSDTRQAWINV